MRDLIVCHTAVRRADEPTKPPVTVAASVLPPAPTEEHMKERGIEDVKVEDAKRHEDEDTMDVEQTPVHPPLKMAARCANEHPPDQPTSVLTDERDAENVPHV